MNTNYKIGDVFNVRIEKIVPRGLGIGFLEDLTVLVPLSATGDLLQVKIEELKKRLAFGSIVSIVEAGPDRIEAPCELFGTCGGCDFQHLSYDAQLAAKVAIIRDCFTRIAKLDYPGEIEVVKSPQEFGYRSRAKWHLAKSGHRIGYFQRESHEVVDIGDCPILSKGLSSTRKYISGGLDCRHVRDENAQLEAATSDNGGISIYARDLAEPITELSYSNGEDHYRYSAETFFQANKMLIPQLIEAAIGGYSGESAIDLYCGVGLFTLPLSRQFRNVTGVEESPVSAAFARRNAANARNIRIICTSVKNYLRGETSVDPGLILLDPPRSGTDKYTIPNLIELSPANISYVSCEPSILARDLKMLLEGGYVIDKVIAVDLFPQTHHIETVVRLSRS